MATIRDLLRPAHRVQFLVTQLPAAPGLVTLEVSGQFVTGKGVPFPLADGHNTDQILALLLDFLSLPGIRLDSLFKGNKFLLAHSRSSLIPLPVARRPPANEALSPATGKPAGAATRPAGPGHTLQILLTEFPAALSLVGLQVGGQLVRGEGVALPAANGHNARQVIALLLDLLTSPASALTAV
jgi:hypothetical protein